MTTLREVLAGRYDIERELGRGGMATVWVARDVRHGRQVAVKVLHDDLASLMGAERFHREINIAARLQHPNIVALYDSGAAGDALYYVMPLIDGESLRSRFERDGALPCAEVMAIVRQVAAALAYAHQRGVVHRDVKPENILMCGAHAFVTDFGISSSIEDARDTRLTQAGMLLGTPAYVSPEQATGGDEVTAASDQYSLACMVFELLAGRPPFTGPTALAVIVRHTMEPPPYLCDLVPDVVPAVADTLIRALSKKPAERFASVEDFLRALTETGSAVAGTGAAAVRGASIAVLPFHEVGHSADESYLGDALADELLHVLSRGTGVRVAARGLAFRFRGDGHDLRTVGRDLAVQTVLSGSVRRAGGRVRVSAELIRTATGERLWADRYDRDLGDLFAMQDELAATIGAALGQHFGASMMAPSPSPARPRGTAIATAYDAYLEARHCWLRAVPGGATAPALLAHARERAEFALALDPNFRDALQVLADCYSVGGIRGLLPWSEARARYQELLYRVLALGGGVPQTHVSLGVTNMYWDDNLVEGGAEFEKAVALEPEWAEAQRLYGAYLKIMGRLDEALVHMREAVRLEPDVPFMINGLADVLMALDRPAEALPLLRRSIELDPSLSVTLDRLARVFDKLGMEADAIDARARWHAVTGNAALGDQLRADMASNGYATARRADSLRLLAALEAQYAIRPLSAELQTTAPMSDRFVVLHGDLGDASGAMDWVVRGHSQRPGRLLRVLTDLQFDRRLLEHDSRYAPLLRSAGLDYLLDANPQSATPHSQDG